MANVEGVDSGRAALQKAVGEAAGGGAGPGSSVSDCRAAW